MVGCEMIDRLTPACVQVRCIAAYILRIRLGTNANHFQVIYSESFSFDAYRIHTNLMRIA